METEVDCGVYAVSQRRRTVGRRADRLRAHSQYVEANRRLERVENLEVRESRNIETT